MTEARKPKRPLQFVMHNLLRCSQRERKQVVNDLITLQTEVFNPRPGLTREAAVERIREYVELATDADRFDIYCRVLLVSDGDRVVGGSTAFVERRDVGDASVIVIRNGANVLPEYRNRGLTGQLFGRLAARYAWRVPLTRRPHYYLGHVMSPVIYHFICGRARFVWPAAEPRMPQMRALYRDLVGDQEVVEETVGSSTDAKTDAWLDRTDSAYVRFFLEKNPEFREGYAMPVLAKLEPYDFVRALGQTLKAQRSTRRIRSILRLS